MGASFLAQNAGKRSVTINLKSAAGKDVFRRLVRTADVVIENFRPGTMEKWGLGYEAMSRLNPGLVMARVSGYGQTGPWSHKAGYGLIGEAMGGLRNITGEPDRPLRDSPISSLGLENQLLPLSLPGPTGQTVVRWSTPETLPSATLPSICP